MGTKALFSKSFQIFHLEPGSIRIFPFAAVSTVLFVVGSVISNSGFSMAEIVYTIVECKSISFTGAWVIYVIYITYFMWTMSIRWPKKKVSELGSPNISSPNFSSHIYGSHYFGSHTLGFFLIFFSWFT